MSGHASRPSLEDSPAFTQSSFYRAFMAAGSEVNVLDDAEAVAAAEAASHFGGGGSGVGLSGSATSQTSLRRRSSLRMPNNRPANRRASSRRQFNLSGIPGGGNGGDINGKPAARDSLASISSGSGTSDTGVGVLHSRASMGGSGLSQEPSIYGDLDIHELSDHLPSGLSPPSKKTEREESWIADARHQMSGKHLLDEATSGSGHGHGAAGYDRGAAASASSTSISSHGFDDVEVREQFRIMAQHEASARVKSNTGFDPHAANLRRKAEEANANIKKQSSASHPPGPKPRTERPLPALKVKEPPSEIPKSYRRVMRRYVDPRAKSPRIPELCPGEVMAGENDSLETRARQCNDEEHLVRCLGCKNGLRVNKMATLVSCPNCHTVSPASSTRR